METIHHMMEHWEAQEHDSPETLKAHGDKAHQSESQKFISMFAIIRILVLSSYLWFEAKKTPLYTYMQVNWMGWPQRGGPTPKKQLLQVKSWNGFMMNLYSIHLLIFCQLLKSLG